MSFIATFSIDSEEVDPLCTNKVWKETFDCDVYTGGTYGFGIGQTAPLFEWIGGEPYFVRILGDCYLCVRAKEPS